MMTHNEQLEAEIQQQIISNIDDFNSFRFNAGAGAGKTFALVESIKHILKRKIKRLRQYNQQAICITYTNVAVGEIKERLGHSELVIVSTIHERLWELIKYYQQELILIHLEKLESEIQRISEALSDISISKHKKFAELSQEEQSGFTEFVINQKEIFYQYLYSPAAGFKKAFNDLDIDKPTCLTNLLSNVSHFRETVKLIYRKERYQQCVGRINNRQETKVTYDSKSNSDRLDYMKFSHDTLLEYGSKIVERHSVLRRIIIDKYPYVFIDEYQDTNEQVVKLVKGLHDYALTHNKSWLVGYFGDTAQNIYDDGVGTRIETLHTNIENIDKPFNRRSHNQVINVINKIRNDDIEQRPIFDDRNSGNINFYHSICANDEDKLSKAQGFLEQFKNDIINGDEAEPPKIHCLVLTNKLMAQLNGFGDTYSVLSQAETIYWKELNTKLLSHDIEKLDPTILLIYNLVTLYLKLQNDSTTFYEVLGQLHSRISFAAVNNLIYSLRGVEVANLGELISAYSRVLGEADLNVHLKKSLLNNISINVEDTNATGSLHSFFLGRFRELMYTNCDDDYTNEEELIKLQSLLNLSLEQLTLWVDFIDRRQNRDVIYHTYHGTKGEEYEYVALILGHDFGGTHQGRNKFKSFFEHIQLDQNEQDERLNLTDYKENFENTKNLIYVACSRAAKDLRLLYLDDVDEIKNGIEQVFDTCEEWQQP
ncbi:hypothetical protein NBRC116592_04860 [Colwellia sp. KU-HH00111]|uniref:UvrD-helicase domain-containing protein n=1 Tax=Colwellia sp. KU-HH00111 TaxID=3127652 RepID=UPI00310B8B7D